jgi:antitoxin component of MazEF toxin-antitoxin module
VSVAGGVNAAGGDRQDRNSQGIRIPKPLLEQAGLGDEVELTLAGRSLIVTRASAS